MFIQHLLLTWLPMEVSWEIRPHSLLLTMQSTMAHGVTSMEATPWFLMGPLVLCNWLSDPTEINYTLDGRLTQLSIFDQALNATQVKTLYKQVRSAKPDCLLLPLSGTR